MKKQILFLFLIIISVVLIILFPNNDTSMNKIIFFKKTSKGSFIKNFHFMQNNNLMQYSSYIIVNSINDYQIVAFVQFNYKYIKNFENISDFRCLITQNGIAIELPTSEAPKLYWNPNKKLIFNYKTKNKWDFEGDGDVGIAIIRIQDFDKNLTEPIENSTGLILPHSLIKFQIPTVIHTVEPRLKSVGLCSHYAYTIPSQLVNWIDLHLSFNISEIVLYDATDGNNLTKMLQKHKYFNEKIILKEYNINRDYLCDEKIICDQYIDDINNTCAILLRSCYQFYEHEFKEKFHWRNKHEQLTSNDCFTQLSQKYEFVIHYDLDEAILPRNTKINNNFKNQVYKCNDYSSICPLKPFENDFYNYINNIIQNYGKDRNKNKLASISFEHAIYLIPNYIEKKLMSDLQDIIQKIDDKNNTIIYPIKLFLSEPPFKNGHNFIIEKNDIDYIQNLSKAYNSVIPCAYHKYISNIDNIDKSLLRHLYFVTEGNQRMGKAIHYSKNVKTIFTHYAQDAVPDTWSITAAALDGHILSHYRDKVSPVYDKNFENSIRKLNVDFEYFFYLLKIFTNFCQI
jgi:hypothetical protein